MSYDHRYAVLNIDGVACQIRGYCAWHPERKRVERFIAERFHLAHGAHIQLFMPLLIALETDQGEILALVGIRGALMEPLFLEHYLTHPIERVISTHAATDTRRQAIVEVGNLAAVKPGYGRYLFAALTDLLTAWGYRWLACTGIASVINIFHRLGMEPIRVAPALAEKIPGGGQGWGDYYAKNPQVMVGDIEKGRQLALRYGLLAHTQYSRTEVTDALTA